MVIWVAVGGRGTLAGAVLGAVAVNWAKTGLSERFPSGWLYLQGLLFVAVIAFAPQGLMGLRRLGQRLGGLGRRARRTQPDRVPSAIDLEAA
jgi:urea transport system permease protein